jgi:hypothetical protein
MNGLPQTERNGSVETWLTPQPLPVAFAAAQAVGWILEVGQRAPRSASKWPNPLRALRPRRVHEIGCARPEYPEGAVATIRVAPI